MPAPTIVSVIVCTRNRASSLRMTLAALAAVRIPQSWHAELILLDNGSTDDTCSVFASAVLPNFVKRLVSEPRRGMCHARNTAIAASRGDTLLFIDDDVVPDRNCLELLAQPLLSSGCDAVTGRVDLAPNLQRTWMRPLHRLWLAELQEPQPFGLELVGASMGFRRAVLDQIPEFDPEIGPGRLGFGDDTLFSWQLQRAGLRLAFVAEARCVHHFDPRRLRRESWIDAARARGRTLAYILHHWEHGSIKNPRLLARYVATKLRLRRLLRKSVAAEGCPLWEISYESRIAKCRQYLIERLRPANYARHGLRRTAAARAASSATAPLAA